MPYLKTSPEIIATISRLKAAKTLWIDTEVADFRTKKPKLSLIQVSDRPDDLSGEHIYILDMLEKPDIVDIFIEQIMVEQNIERVFHNASYDLKFLGGKKSKNITCTLEIAKKIPYYLLPVANYKLETLVTELCNYHDIDKSAQTSDWGFRPLSDGQIEYAYLDCIYLIQLHQRLIELATAANPQPETEDLSHLTARYQEIFTQYKLLASEVEHLEERIKKVMQAQAIEETNILKLTSYQRTTTKVKFADLMRVVNSDNLDIDFPITLTKQLQAEIGESLAKMNPEIETSASVRLSIKQTDTDG